jgi:ATP-GRASP peptide maturase of grasp-with-spasm system
MILILSYNTGTVNILIDWLMSKSIDFDRLNPDDFVANLNSISLSGSIPSCEIEFNGRIINLEKYTVVWIWHANLWFENCHPQITSSFDPSFKHLLENLNYHHEVIRTFVGNFFYYTNALVIGNYHKQELNKLDTLLKAKKCGLTIPTTNIITTKEEYLKIARSYPVIIKPYYEITNFELDGQEYINLTSELNNDEVSEMEESFYPSMVQEKIEKLFEIRSFYLLGSFYSMAIFSQKNEQTKLDFRNYETKVSNRFTPIQLPLEVETKLNVLIQDIGLNTCSVDLIFTPKGEYVFLEINPVGQFGMVSVPCNYYLEKKMMQILCYEKSDTAS